MEKQRKELGNGKSESFETIGEDEDMFIISNLIFI